MHAILEYWGSLRPITLDQVPVCARLNGRPVVTGLPVPTDDLVPVAGGPS